MKENEIQIVTLEKQKDAYQVSIIDHSTNHVIRIDQSAIHDQEEYCQLSTCKMPSEMEVAPRYTLPTLFTLLTLFNTVLTVYTILTASHCLNSDMHAFC